MNFAARLRTKEKYLRGGGGGRGRNAHGLDGRVVEGRVLLEAFAAGAVVRLEAGPLASGRADGGAALGAATAGVGRRGAGRTGAAEAEALEQRVLLRAGGAARALPALVLLQQLLQQLVGTLEAGARLHVVVLALVVQQLTNKNTHCLSLNRIW